MARASWVYRWLLNLLHTFFDYIFVSIDTHQPGVPLPCLVSLRVLGCFINEVYDLVFSFRSRFDGA